MAANASDRSLVLFAQAAQAMIASAAQPTKPLISRLADLAQEADAKGLKSLSLELQVARADALLRLGDRDAAFRDADRALARAEALGSKVSAAKSHFVKASALRAKADSSARREFSLVVRLFEEVKGDEGNGNVLKRADVAPIYEESVKGSK